MIDTGCRPRGTFPAGPCAITLRLPPLAFVTKTLVKLLDMGGFPMVYTHQAWFTYCALFAPRLWLPERCLPDSISRVDVPRWSPSSLMHSTTKQTCVPETIERNMGKTFSFRGTESYSGPQVPKCGTPRSGAEPSEASSARPAAIPLFSVQGETSRSPMNKLASFPFLANSRHSQYQNSPHIMTSSVRAWLIRGRLGEQSCHAVGLPQHQASSLQHEDMIRGGRIRAGCSCST